jgi:hypothetical protein
LLWVLDPLHHSIILLSYEYHITIILVSYYYHIKSSINKSQKFQAFQGMIDHHLCTETQKNV